MNGRRNAIWLALLGAFASAAFSSAASASASEVTLTLDPAQSTVTWRLGALLHTVDGTFALKRGTVRFDSGPSDKAAGEVVLDLTSGHSGNAKRDRRMQTEILETQRYPDAILTIDRVAGHLAGSAPSALDLHGTLLIHGASHEMTLHLAINNSAGRLTAHTAFTVPYVAWGMKDPSTFVLRVNDHVDLDIDAVLTRSEAPTP